MPHPCMICGTLTIERKSLPWPNLRKPFRNFRTCATIPTQPQVHYRCCYSYLGTLKPVRADVRNNLMTERRPLPGIFPTGRWLHAFIILVLPSMTDLDTACMAVTTLNVAASLLNQQQSRSGRLAGISPQAYCSFP